MERYLTTKFYQRNEDWYNLDDVYSYIEYPAKRCGTYDLGKDEES